MIYGLYLAAAGSLIEKAKSEILANNLANVNTAGFKKAYVSARERQAEMDPRRPGGASLDALLGGGGVLLDQTRHDYTDGVMTSTGQPLDIALVGQGFFAVSDGDNTYYTRAGNFTIDAENQIATADGRYKLLGGGGEPITISGGTADGGIEITRDGVLYQGGNELGRLRVVDFDDRENLEKYGDNLFVYTGDEGETAAGAKVRQGFIEKSNVNSVQELSDMIVAQRAYEANMRMLRTIDTTLGRTVTEVGGIPR